MPRVGSCIAWTGVALACAAASAQSSVYAPPPAADAGERTVVVRGPSGERYQRTSPAPIASPSSTVIDGAVQQATAYAVGNSGTVENADYELSPADHLAASGESQPALSPIESAPTAPSDERRTLKRRDARSPSAGSARPSPLADLGWDEFNSESLATVGASLAVVLGLVMMMAWVWRRAAPRSSRALPEEVVSVVGRVPLAGRQVAQLIKVGSKLILVNVTPDGVEPITEITDPAEVTRLLGICEQASPYSASAAFKDVFDQIAREPAAPGFLGGEAPLVDRQKLADAYANTPGGRAHA